MLEPSPLQPVLDAVERAGALDAPGRALGRFVRRSLGSGVVKDVISGTWLGNSVHAPMTDAVVGPLLSASLLDLVDRDNPRSAQRLVEAGLVTAVPTMLVEHPATFAGVRARRAALRRTVEGHPYHQYE